MTANKPDWKTAPEWANWLAQDLSGDWAWHEERPLPIIQYWSGDGRERLAFRAYDDQHQNKRWTETLEPRETPIPTELYNRLVYLGIIDLSGNRSTNEGDSNYAEKTIQPHSIWLDYPELTSFDHDVVKRILRTKKGNSRLLEYKKIIEVCNERIRQIEITGVDE